MTAPLRVEVGAVGEPVLVDGVVVGERVSPRAAVVEVLGRRCRWVAFEPSTRAVRRVVRVEWSRHAAQGAGSAS